ncbi:MAG: InlB B-repeat-containing protein, partial [Clostridia bacterium]|nr:InlB B-repeat-containing protein [Clostridia bacterium]
MKLLTRLGKNTLVILLALAIFAGPALPSFAAPQQELRRGGNIASSEEDLAGIPSAPELVGAPAGSLPVKVDLSLNCPVPIDQTHNNCGPITLAYGLRTWQEQDIRRWGQDTPDHQFSPAFLYNLCNGGTDDGTKIPDLLKVAKDQGVCTLQSMPENTGLKVQPTAAQKAEAANYKIKAYYTIGHAPSGFWEHTVTAWKEKLSNNIPFIIGIPIYDDYWFAGDTGYDSIYDNTSGGYWGRHAMLIVGYDDNIAVKDGTKGAFKLMNSWGTRWGEGGFGYISYKMLEQNAKTSNEASWEAFYCESATPPSQTFTVQFNANGGAGMMPSQTFSQGAAQKLSPNTFIKAGFKFKGWADSPNGLEMYTDGQTVVINSNTTLYAVWGKDNGPASFKVRFDPNGGTGAMPVQDFTEGEAQKLSPCAFNRAEHIFRGWAESPEGDRVFSDGQNVIIGRDTTLYAVWQSTAAMPDAEKLAAFLAQSDGFKSNAEKLGWNIDNVKSWTGATWQGENLVTLEMLSEAEPLAGNLVLTGCKALEKLDCYLNNISSIDLFGCSALRFLWCDWNNLTYLDIKGCPSLEELSCWGGSLT